MSCFFADRVRRVLVCSLTECQGPECVAAFGKLRVLRLVGLAFYRAHSLYVGCELYDGLEMREGERPS